MVANISKVNTVAKYGKNKKINRIKIYASSKTRVMEITDVFPS